MKRKAWIDELKGFAIILVVLGHTLAGYRDAGIFDNAIGGAIVDGIYTFHMPLFIMVSGYLFGVSYVNHDNPNKLTAKWDKIKKQVVNLVWVYFVFNIITLLVKLIGINMGGNYVDPVDASTFLMLPIKPYVVFWYLYVLIILYLITPFILKLNMYIVLVVSGISTVVYIIFFPTLGDEYPVFKVILYAFFFLFGCYLHTHDSPLMRKQIYLQLLAVVACFVLFYLGVFNNIPILYGLIKFGIAFLLSNLIIKFFGKRAHVRTPISAIGKQTLEIYTIHPIVLGIVKSITVALGPCYYWLWVAISTAAGLFIPVLISLALRLLKIRDIFYKPSKYIFKNK